MSSSSFLQVTAQKMHDAVGQSGVYTGQIHVDSGLPHGRGTMEYVTPENVQANPNMIVANYEGEWQRGFWQGHGLCVLKNGDSYTGEFVQHERHGNGEYQWKMGANHKQRLYQGMFHHNQRHGHGKYIWRTMQPTGNNAPDEPEELEVVSESTYVGMFDNGQRQGHGVYQSPSLTYTGDWKAGQYHGYGVLESNKIANSSLNSKTYKGYFNRGQRHGRGVETEHTKDASSGKVTDTVIHEGQWRNDQPAHEEQEDPILLDPVDTATPHNQHHHQHQQQPSPSKPATPKQQTIVLSKPEPCIDGEGREGFYKGIMQDNLPEGVGTMKYQHHPELMMEYEGFWIKGMKHGFGRVLYMNGDSYQGDFAQNQKQGQGEWKLSDGRQFKGTFLKDLPHTQPDKPEEKIRVVYPQNDMFHGQYSNGNRSGRGRFTWVDGGYYDGFWADGLYQGKGELGTAHTKYTGEFQKGKYEGQGRLMNLLTDQVIYEGVWKGGVPADDSVKIENDKKLLHIPQPPLDSDVSQSRQQGRTAAPVNSNFGGSSNNKGPSTELLSKSACKAVVDLSVVDGQDNPGRYTGILHVASKKPHGVGRMVYDDGNRVHEGFWEFGHRQGHGRCLFVHIGDFHEGNYEQNLRQGQGTYYWKDGRQFVGQYHGDERHGPGVFTYPNGDLYDGNFEHGQRSGFGTFTFHNKTCHYKGEWKVGMYSGEGQLAWQSVKETRKVTPTSEQITRETCKHRYEGNFESGVFDGKGKEFENDKLVRQGVWAKGKFVEESAVPVTAPDLLDEPGNDAADAAPADSSSGQSSQAAGQDEEETTNKVPTATGDNTAEVGAEAPANPTQAEEPVADENQAPTPAPQKEAIPAATESQ
eukprot:CAMPEP_0113624438 /NCGR_PEP_ID=MMETSP0017_2-20120614/12593_1 /TAXON_ID=2856 /ORGANISM="Cylindrotheca closterium" /LENGTH=862 /DNA_ID=CAMNT_0000534459 /DNA_START=96 /DNA_END=2681 /DNA_ORIENTATION=+ /assembly_acc=CAM_ASM_000147